ncbi:MAG: metal-sensitive transcriptional regulator [Rhodospirillales bacterium]|nr:metal-sensitive transcriptional regulator [Alphaproteobacteria bacterium]MCB9981777.1 metal-sensitive transcriptional regulator [Rhodospirillales bacterium]
MSDQHPCHNAEIPKLNRIAGQIEGIKRMIEDGRYCPDILTQLRAARAAIRTVEAHVLETHLHHCVAEAMTADNAQEKIDEIKDLFKRYDEV